MAEQTIIQGDCLEVMRGFADKSFDLVLTDPPYGITQNKWDVAFDLKDWWNQLDRVCSGIKVIFASQPFTTRLIASNEKMFKYCLVWDKKLKTGHLNAKIRPMMQTEDIVIFGSGKYNPQFEEGAPTHSQGSRDGVSFSENYGEQKLTYEDKAGSTRKYPSNLLSFQKVHPSKAQHPTEKPVALLKYLIETYSDEGDSILDPFMGSGTTLVAAKHLGRSATGIEISPKYCEVARNRLAQQQLF